MHAGCRTQSLSQCVQEDAQQSFTLCMLESCLCRLSRLSPALLVALTPSKRGCVYCIGVLHMAAFHQGWTPGTGAAAVQPVHVCSMWYSSKGSNSALSAAADNAARNATAPGCCFRPLPAAICNPATAERRWQNY
jgi:hypothetical protein